MLLFRIRKRSIIIRRRSRNGRRSDVLIHAKINGLLAALRSVVIRAVDVLEDVVEGIRHDGADAGVAGEDAVRDVPGRAVGQRPADDVEEHEDVVLEQRPEDLLRLLGVGLPLVAADEELGEVAVLLDDADEGRQRVAVEEVSSEVEALEADAVVDGRAGADEGLGEGMAAADADAVLAEIERRDGAAAGQGAGKLDRGGVAELVAAEVQVADAVAHGELRDGARAAGAEAVAVERQLEQRAVLGREDLGERVAADFGDLVLRKVEDAEPDLVLGEGLRDDLRCRVGHLDVAEAELAKHVGALGEGAEERGDAVRRNVVAVEVKHAHVVRLLECVGDARDVGVVERRLAVGEEALAGAVVEGVEELNNDGSLGLFARRKINCNCSTSDVGHYFLFLINYFFLRRYV